MIVLGADTHKRSHAIAAVAAPTGELLGEQTVPVGERGFGALLRWARRLDDERVWALEDCRHVSGSLERFLIERGERVLRIPTHLTANARKRARQRGKSDPIDALNVARVALQEGLEAFPAAQLDGPELDLRLLVDHRERLVQVGDDEDPESIVAKLAAAQQADTQEHADAREDAINGVRQGRFPIAFLAGLVARSTADAIVRNGARPLAVFDRETYEGEVEAAAAALEAAAASWDETALVTLAELSQEHADWLRAALAGSVVGRTVKDSLAEAVARQMGGEQVATMQILPDGTPRIYEEDPDTVARIRTLEQGAADLVASGSPGNV